MTYAALFKIYYIDAFVIRQLDRLKARVGDGVVYVIADETKGPLGPIPHDRVIRITESEMLRRGFETCEPDLSMFWHSADYSLYPLVEDYEAYDHYFTVEYDAVINTDLDALVAKLAAQQLDFAGLRATQPVTQWYWTATVDTLYDAAVLRPYLNAIAIYSYRGVMLLRERRLELSRRFRAGEIKQLPLSEAFIATELEQQNFRIGNLADFGDTSRYTWWPPNVEAELDDLTHCTLIHPVLEGMRCANSLLRADHLHLLFTPNWAVAQRLAMLRPRDYLPRLLAILLKGETHSAARYPIEDLPAPLFEQPDPSPNIARGKPATQSSVSDHSRNPAIRDDAGGAVNGLVTGTYGFHTGFDNPPWWMVDLEATYRLTKIWIFNRLDSPTTLQHIKLLLSPDGLNWTLRLEHRSEGNFGGAWGEPLAIDFADNALARYVRIESGRAGFLHLDQVKIFGSLAT